MVELLQAGNFAFTQMIVDGTMGKSFGCFEAIPLNYDLGGILRYTPRR